ncbi:uncharacterized protein LOC135170489 [Diachasmimorpha longicaudata]|uniref:uncharacterized protein LOC135170489 n=1 Tax=Diachasmimorpha longicaudata TaxID=58733 RepID=UPI0030B86BE9
MKFSPTERSSEIGRDNEEITPPVYLTPDFFQDFSRRSWGSSAESTPPFSLIHKKKYEEIRREEETQEAVARDLEDRTSQLAQVAGLCPLNHGNFELCLPENG